LYPRLVTCLLWIDVKLPVSLLWQLEQSGLLLRVAFGV
jgi:hypothetical protein